MKILILMEGLGWPRRLWQLRPAFGQKKHGRDVVVFLGVAQRNTATL